MLHESNPDKPEYLAARAELRGAAGLTASFGELPRAAVELRRAARPVLTLTLTLTVTLTLTLNPNPSPSPNPNPNPNPDPDH